MCVCVCVCVGGCVCVCVCVCVLSMHGCSHFAGYVGIDGSIVVTYYLNNPYKNAKNVYTYVWTCVVILQLTTQKINSKDLFLKPKHQ